MTNEQTCNPSGRAPHRSGRAWAGHVASRVRFNQPAACLLFLAWSNSLCNWLNLVFLFSPLPSSSLQGSLPSLAQRDQNPRSCCMKHTDLKGMVITQLQLETYWFPSAYGFASCIGSLASEKYIGAVSRVVYGASTSPLLHVARIDVLFQIRFNTSCNTTDTNLS